jgi:hypothetical protein
MDHPLIITSIILNRSVAFKACGTLAGMMIASPV